MCQVLFEAWRIQQQMKETWTQHVDGELSKITCILNSAFLHMLGKCYREKQSRVWSMGMQGNSNAMGWSEKDFLRKWYLSKDLMEVRE